MPARDEVTELSLRCHRGVTEVVVKEGKMPPISDLAVVDCENVGDLYVHLQDVSSSGVAQRPLIPVSSSQIIISRN